MSNQTTLFVIPNELLQFLNPTTRLGAPKFLRLPHPRTGLNTLFIAIPSQVDMEDMDLLELQVIDPDVGRSWMFNETVSSNGKLFMITPVDPAYILAPLLRKHFTARQTLQEADSLLDELASNGDIVNLEHELDFRRFISYKCVTACLSRICETKTIAVAGIVTYCYKEERWLHYLRKKVDLVEDLIVSERFPVFERAFARDGLLGTDQDDLLKSARTKAAVNILSQYLPEDVHASLLSCFDLSRLEEYDQRLQEEATALLAAQAPKKKSKPSVVEGGKRKATTQISRGVDKLKKANTVGMSKLSAFFQKPAK